ncbi:hypothetical protein HanXRQr2_Chr15g0718161 [Helianthus annuus]|uniref:Uncharacterized protein n=2 Tax=Helianthus annuus TaxID=4232 RepID=A0A9K3E479_HELAN|nr:hypothetical protein HanXRQr2_Chr15g0718161 [Helianthus annuus]KAJ0833321.1 hypothetical protein HanPSC8_Chr15g0689011 [Helianthus annuus]
MNIHLDLLAIYIEEIRDLARYAMSSSCVGEMMSSEFRDCDFCLDESQVLNCVLFMSFGCVVCTMFLLCHVVIRCKCRLLKTMLSCFIFLDLK